MFLTLRPDLKGTFPAEIIGLTRNSMFRRWKPDNGREHEKMEQEVAL